MRILVLLDPPETLRPTSDTSAIIMQELLQRGHEVSFCKINDLWVQNGSLFTKAYGVMHVDLLQQPIFAAKPPQILQVSDFHVVLVRKDPPFDQMYLWMTQMLECVRGHVFFLNDPKGLREANEKLYIFQFPELIAPTLVTCNVAQIRHFLQEQSGQIVVKPLDGFGGQGIFYVRADDPNTNVILETITQQETRLVMAQRYLPEGRQGDKRILLLEGKPIGTLLRIPQAHDVRSNLRAGGQAYKTELSSRDYEICETLAPRLLQDGLHFVGIDIIGGYLTEVNVTSPTGIQAINRLENTQVEKQIVDFLERSVESKDF